MQIAPRTTFRGFRPSTAVRNDIRERIDRLGAVYPSLIRCRTIMELVHRHVRGNHFHVRIELSVPGETIVIAHEARLRAAGRREADPGHKDPHVAVRDAFGLARRRLQGRARRAA
jgi:Sigma 54 modulation protein / S30EA ribosomal protein